jgi:hypothetical protein
MALNPTVRKLSLHAVNKTVPKVLADHQRQGLLVSPATPAELKDLWSPRHASYKHSSNPERTVAQQDDLRDVEGIPETEQEAVLTRVRCYPPYDKQPLSIRLIRLARLVTPQLTIYSQRLHEEPATHGPLSDRSKFEMAFPPNGGTIEVQHARDRKGLWAGAEHFSITDPDVRIYLPPQIRTLKVSQSDPASDAAQALCFFIAKGSPFIAVNAVSIGDSRARFVVANGIHRLYRLAYLGEEWAPVVFVEAPGGRPDDQIADFTWGLLANPKAQVPLLVDFLRPEVTMDLEYRPEVNRMTLNWQCEQHPDPAVKIEDLE